MSEKENQKEKKLGLDEKVPEIAKGSDYYALLTFIMAIIAIVTLLAYMIVGKKSFFVNNSIYVVLYIIVISYIVAYCDHKERKFAIAKGICMLLVLVMELVLDRKILMNFFKQAVNSFKDLPDHYAFYLSAYLIFVILFAVWVIFDFIHDILGTYTKKNCVIFSVFGILTALMAFVRLYAQVSFYYADEISSMSKGILYFLYQALAFVFFVLTNLFAVYRREYHN